MAATSVKAPAGEPPLSGSSSGSGSGWLGSWWMVGGLALLMLWFFTAGLVVLVGAEVDRMLNVRRRATRADPVVAR